MLYNYAFHSLLTDWANDNEFFRLMWQNYYENESANVDLKKKFAGIFSNIVVTGLPVTDLFLTEKHEDKWKKQIRVVNGLFGHHISQYLMVAV